MEIYLNVAEWGPGNIYGIEAAQIRLNVQQAATEASSSRAISSDLGPTANSTTKRAFTAKAA